MGSVVVAQGRSMWELHRSGIKPVLAGGFFTTDTLGTLNKHFSECPLGVRTIFRSTVTKINEGDSLRLSRSRLVGETDVTTHSGQTVP